MVFIKVLSRLPLFLLYKISDFLFLVLFYLIRYRRKVVSKNLHLAFPNLSSEQIHIIAKSFYKNLCDVIIETVKAYSISKEDLKKRVVLKNRAIVDQYYNKGQPIIVMTSHLGNWEWLLLANCLHLDFPVDAVYKRLKNKSFDKFMKSLRSRFGAIPVEKDSLLRDVAKKKVIPRIVAMVSDQSPATSNNNVWYNFLGVEVPFYSGAAKIALATNYPVVFVNMKRVKRGYYEASFYELGRPPYDKANNNIIQNYIQFVEQSIKENPSEWLWSHKRWKHKRN